MWLLQHTVISDSRGVWGVYDHVLHDNPPLPVGVLHISTPLIDTHSTPSASSDTMTLSPGLSSESDALLPSCPELLPPGATVFPPYMILLSRQIHASDK